MSHRSYFGTDGIRGRVGTSLMNAEFMLKLGWAAGKVLSRQSHSAVLIGKDTRISGYMLESALLAGFSAAGVDTYLVGPMPTPAVAYLTRSVRAAAGVVLSASHNPYEDNGVKFFDQSGFKLSDQMERDIEKMIDTPMRTVVSKAIGRATRLNDAPGRYIEFCKQSFPGHLTLKPYKVVIDCAHGATYAVAPRIFYELGAQVVTVSADPDGFNINENCGATNTEQLQATVLEAGADLGLAFDGDGDRLIMVDHYGEVVDGDQVLGILALFCAPADRPVGVVGTIMSNLGLERALTAAQIPFLRSSVGDRHVLASLKQRGWVLGGESSGHIVDLRQSTTGDGIIAALGVLKIMQESGKSLAALKSVVDKVPQTLTNLPCPFEQQAVVHDPEISSVIDQMQLKMGDAGRILVRPSGTEPLIRVMVEGVCADQVDAVSRALTKAIAARI